MNPTCVVKPAGDACGCGMLNQTHRKKLSIAPVPTSRRGYRNSLRRDILSLSPAAARTQAPVAERPVALPPVRHAERAMAASPEEFREFAQECLRWAGETKSDRHRQVLREMARTWIQAALELERSLGLISGGALLRSSKPRPAK